ncbi:MAG: D-2-hydroxyacid dehydrogenase [Spirochaetota bacterium]|nr:D-2-hydroxyacid dehydrogenase [Spirochaetota bacterium]
MEIVFLDSGSYGDDIDLTGFKKFGNVTFYPYTSAAAVQNRILNAEVIVINNTAISNSDLESAHKLKLIAIAATGTDNVDLNYCRKAGIQVRNVTGYATESVAQHTFAMLFHLMEQTAYYDFYIKSGTWSRSGLPTHMERKFMQLTGKRWGIIGLGNIGKRVATLASAFGCEIVYYNRYSDTHNKEYEGIQLQALLQTSDIISIHAPLNNKTRNMITKKELALLKTGTILLNLGRGAIVNELDLADAIDNNGILVGLDVFTKEPIEIANPLLKLKMPHHLVTTPHIGFAAKEAREAVIKGTLKNIKDFITEHSLNSTSH